MVAGPQAFPAYMGIALATALSNVGAAYGTAKAGVSYLSWKLLKRMTSLISTS